jgi:hypothetical protein
LLILGRKASGKTLLLNTLLRAAQEGSNGAFLQCYIDYSDATHARLPSEYMLDSAPTSAKREYHRLLASRPLVHPITLLNEAFAKVGVFMFVAVDELQNVYTKDCEKGSRIIGQLNVLGGLDGRAIYAALSGSSTHLRALATAKLSEDKKSSFPNYANIDLNSTKFEPKTIYSIVSPNEFKDALEFIARAAGKSIENFEARRRNILLKTGGCPGLMHAAIISPDDVGHPYTLSLGSASSDSFLLALRDVIMLRCRDTSGDEFLNASMQLVPLRLVLSRLTDMTLSHVYNLADACKIRFDDWSEEKMVGFASPGAFMELHRESKQMSFFALFTLKIFYAHDAERTTLECLAKNSESWLSGVELSSSSLDDLVLPGPNERRATDVSKFNRMMKEIYVDDRDSFGADGVVLVPSDDGDSMVSVHRIQVKLGVKSISENEAKKWADRFATMKNEAQSAYDRAGFSWKNNTDIRYIVTTRPMAPEAREVLKDANIKLIDQAFLAKHIWPNEVKEMGKPFSS